MTVADCNILLEAESCLFADDDNVFREWCKQVKAVAEKVDENHKTLIAKWIAPVAYKLYLVSKTNLSHRTPKLIGRMCGLGDVWLYNYIDLHMQSRVVDEVLFDPKEKYVNIKAVRKLCRQMMKNQDINEDGTPVISPHVKVAAGKLLLLTYKKETPKKTEILNLGGDVHGDVIAGEVTQNIIRNPDAIPGFTDKSSKERIIKARELIEAKKKEMDSKKDESDIIDGEFEED